MVVEAVGDSTDRGGTSRRGLFETREEEMARQRGWALGERSRSEPVFLPENPDPTDFLPSTLLARGAQPLTWPWEPSCFPVVPPASVSHLCNGALGLDLRGPISGSVACYLTGSCPSCGECLSRESPSTCEFSALPSSRHWDRAASRGPLGFVSQFRS